MTLERHFEANTFGGTYTEMSTVYWKFVHNYQIKAECFENYENNDQQHDAQI